MVPTRWWRRRLIKASMCVSLGLLVGACGGGADQDASESVNASVSSDKALGGSETLSSAARRKALSHDRKGVVSVIVSRDGSTIGVANADGSVRVLDSASAREIRTLKAEGGNPVAGILFSTDGRYLVAIGKDSLTQVWNVETGERRFMLRGHAHPLRAVAASADGSIIATGGEETRVMLWDGMTGRLKQVLTGPTDFVNSLSVSSDGRLLASGDADARILIWDVATGRLLQTLRGHSNEVNAIVFSADGKRLVSAGEDGKVLLWDVGAGRQMLALQGQGAPVRSLALSGDGDFLAAGGLNGTVVVWDMTTRTLVQDFAASTAAVNSVVFDRNTKGQLFVGGEESRVRSLNVSRNAAR